MGQQNHREGRVERGFMPLFEANPVPSALVRKADQRFVAVNRAYVMAPTVNISLVLAGTFATPSTAGLMDDIIPIAETMVVTQWVTRAIKVGLARTRPYAH